MTRTIRAADLFCGAGGTSTGLALACAQLGAKLQLVAVDHWEIAVETHAANHPWAEHVCETIDSVDPRKVCPGGLDILLASPECTHHSIARGGRPMCDQSRSTAWHVLRWAEALLPRVVILENVREWRTWGPLGVNGRPLKSRRGETYQAFLAALRSLGYQVEDRLLNAADFGDPTCRRRLFVIATRGRTAVRWPTPSHTEDPGLFEGEIGQWRPARDIIDWGLSGKSIFGRKRPLAEKTLERIEAGMKRFGWPESFLVTLYGHRGMRRLDRPAPTVTTIPAHIALVHPFILPHRQFEATNKQWTDSIDNPLRTITATNGAGYLVRPSQVQVDVRFRMLAPHELAAAMSFPDGYHFAGKRDDQVRQIGNAVPVQTARALCREMLSQIVRDRGGLPARRVRGGDVSVRRLPDGNLTAGGGDR